MTTHDIADLYELSPLQQGILFHSLEAPDPGMYCVQLRFELQGALDADIFARCWQLVIDRQAVLRTSFHWQEADKPLQVVHRRVQLPLQQLDWRAVPADRQQEQLEDYIAADRQIGFDLSQPPLMRLALIRLEEQRYQCLWSKHHLILDGWSTALVLKEALELYHIIHQGLPWPPAVGLAYRDYIAWLQQQDLQQAENFWRQALRGFSAPTPLGVGCQTNGAKEAGGAEQLLHLPQALSEQLQRQVRAHQLTLNTLIQGAWALLLSRYSGEADVVFGATCSGRPAALSGVETMVGLFINTLPVRVQVQPDCTVLGWLKQLQVQQALARQFEYSPLVEVQGWSAVPRGLPLFESIVVFENYPVDPSLRQMEAGFRVSRVHTVERTNYPLTVIAVLGGQLSLRVLYEPQRFDVPTIERMLGHLQMLLSGLASHLEAGCLAEVPMLTPAERQQLLGKWNATRRAFAQDRCLHALFEDQVERTPDAVAAVCAGRELTYRQLDEQANQLAHHLQALGAGPDVPVGLCLERSERMLVGLLGILKAGSAYVPLDAAYPEARLASMLADAQAPVVVTEQHLASRLDCSGVQTVYLDTEGEVIARRGVHLPHSQVRCDHLAYIIYTSGSTGRPKGVAIEHRSAVTLMHWAREVFSPQTLSGVLAATSLCFDLSVFELFAPLCWGGRVLLVENILAARDATGEVTLINTVPSALVELLRLQELPASVHTVNLAGEPLPPGLVRRLYHQGHIRQVFNLYGPSEDTTYSTWALASPDGEGPVPIGRPLANTQVYVLDDHRQPLPVGIPGELYIGGAGLARGYLNQPQLSAERFVPNPFDEQPGARLYRTGDRVRWLPDGQLEFLGRLDGQIKLRGFRIEPGEIEAVLGAHPQVQQAVVLADGEPARLVAYVAGHDPHRPPPEESLRQYLRARLPEYMVPSVFVVLPSLPLTPNGKLDRKALPQPLMERAAAHDTFVPARTSIEQRLAQLWSELLRVHPIGMGDSFLALGGHSLLATRLVARVRESFEVDLPLRSVFEASTAAELAARIEALQVQAVPVAAPLPLLARPERLPLSFAQERLWFLEQLQPGTCTYHIPIALHLSGPLDAAALEQAFQALLQRHESLRTTFHLEEGQPVQRIATAVSRALPLLDLQALPAEQQQQQAQQRFAQLSRQPFALAVEPPVRVQLLRLDEQDHRLLLVFHHIAFDEWSARVLTQELTHLYRAFHTGTPPQLPELSVQYADFALQQRHTLQETTLQTLLDFWQQLLPTPLPVLQLPTDHPRPPVQTFGGRRHTLTLEPALSAQLHALARRHQATLFMTLLAAFAGLLSRHSAQHSVLVGIPAANREHHQLQHTIGLLTNTLVLPVDLGDDPDFATLLMRVRQIALQAYDHQQLPFEKLVEHLQPQRELGQNPLFQVLFSLQNAPLQPWQWPEGLRVVPETIDTETAKFDLSLSIVESAQGLRASFEYNSALFEAATIERWAEHYRNLLSAVVAAPTVRLSQLAILEEPERQQLQQWGRGTDAVLSAPSVVDLFAAQVRRTPQATAVVHRQERLTYAQLAERAERLAGYLHALGVGAGVRVGVLVERSVAMVVAVLAVLKAGGSYVPLEASLPVERLRWMVSDAGVGWVLSDGCSGVAEQLDVRWVDLEAVAEQLAQAAQVPEPVAVRGEEEAYLIYTSGSTGRPKGVQVLHSGVANFLEAMGRQLHLSAKDVLLAVTTLSFDIAVLELLLPLTVGAQTVVADRQTVLDGRRLAQLLEQSGATVMQATPSGWRLLLESGWQGCAGLTMLCGGEALMPELAGRLLERGAALWNLYGPTETTIWSTAARLTAAEQPVPIGRPLANTQVYVLDDHRQPLPVGIPGELYIGGAGLARGYLNQPQLSAERFVPNPFDEQPGARLYRTGDRVRWLPDGQLEFLGRLDGQIKLRGFRIEPGEIEAVLGAHPQVQQAVVLADGEPARLVAYVAGHDPHRPPPEESLRQYLRARLPEYMVPSVFVVLPSLPLTPNGKLDRKALPQPQAGRPRSQTAFVLPGTEAERTVAAIWQEVLQLEKVGVHDHFFDLGGTSLLAVQVHNRLRDAFAKELSIIDLFRYPTVQALAQHLGSADDRPVDLAAERRSGQQQTGKERLKTRLQRRQQAHAHEQTTEARGSDDG
ncbi:non-ribosomal peptide synthetase [Gloeobacter morelensis]|uniref:Amino acid adenylation domain-containing protein n=1 Tax=Gloeobacter morelensis MG652769 TaxID=2781736 RepID=A0ABY3PJS3_9CYAN|nr:non-ribosomal peptide synthetase [Gloeobacter morelensis]UFP93834.1 amino acid adenylation domain-containing protein [Gloeobacter morelensis MG652769]